MRALPPALRSVSPSELARRLELERRGTPFLVYLDGDGRQRIAELDGADSLSIGRQPTADVALTWDTEVSRVHAVLERTGGEWTLVDDGLSRNGTFVNGRRVRGRCRLGGGDAILVGRTSLAFVTGRAPESRTTDATQYREPPDISPAQTRVLEALCAPVAASPFAAPATNREIAAALYLSPETVKRHLHDLFDRFGVEDLPQNRKRAELVRLAFERGVVA